MKKFKNLKIVAYWTMDFRYLLYLFFVITGYARASVWNNLNCPAPRAPDNGLSFIFRNGELVHFRCHPGYVMRGKPVAYCVNNVWTDAAPECIPIQKWPLQVNSENDVYHYQNRKTGQNSDLSQTDKQRQLFNWGDTDDSQTSKQSVYGDGPRRLPLINGIWPPQDQKEQVLALGPQSTPGPKTMIKEEIDIAELRNKQLEELQKQRFSDSKGKRRQGYKKNKNKRKNSVLIDDTVPRETVLSLGNTEDGQALSIAFSRPENRTENLHSKHRHRHRGGRKKKHHGKKYRAYYPTSSGFIISRASRVDTSGIAPYHTRYQFGSPRNNEVAELRGRPVEQVHGLHNSTHSNLYEYDTSCVEPLYGREVPMIAPQVSNAFVFRYETKKNRFYPFNSFMLVKYRCLSGFVFVNARAQTLHCKEASWVGEVPRCVRSSAVN